MGKRIIIDMDLEDMKFHMDSNNKTTYESIGIEKRAAQRSPRRKT